MGYFLDKFKERVEKIVNGPDLSIPKTTVRPISHDLQQSYTVYKQQEGSDEKTAIAFNLNREEAERLARLTKTKLTKINDNQYLLIYPKIEEDTAWIKD